MLNITKSLVCLALAAYLWCGETWTLLESEGYSWTPRVMVITGATAALAILPLFFHERGIWNRIAVGVSTFLIGAFVFQAVLSRTAGQFDGKIAASESVSQSRSLLEAELARERSRLEDAKDNEKYESRRGGCKATCEHWKRAAEGSQSRIDKLMKELAAKAPAPVADAASYRIEKITLGHISEETARIWNPVYQPLGFLAGICVMLSLALRFFNEFLKSRVSKTVLAVSGNSEPEVSGGGKGFHLIQGGKVTDREIEAVRSALSGGKTLTNDELAALMETTKGEASKRVAVAQAMGVVSKRRNGRHVAIQLAHAH